MPNITGALASVASVAAGAGTHAPPIHRIVAAASSSASTVAAGGVFTSPPPQIPPSVTEAPQARPGALFFAVELETVGFGEIGAPLRGYMAEPHFEVDGRWQPVETTETLRASDMGYRTRMGIDPVQAVYPPLLDRAFEVDRRMPLAPGDAAIAAAWGRLRLLNAGGIWDGVAATRSCDGRTIRVLQGRKGMDRRRIPLDPAYSTLTVAFAGVAQGWFLAETALEVPLRDASYWIERPLQSALYTGGGLLEGPAEMAGQAKPKVRGGTALQPVRDVAPILVDPTQRIYQWTDALGQIVALYEGGDANISFQADVSNLYAGTTNPGQYRTNNARGLFQLGSTPVRPITIDCVGAFPTAGGVSTAAGVVKNLLLEDLGVEPQFLDTASFDAAAAAYPAPCGWAWSGQSDAVEALSVFLRAIGGKLIPTRDGKLRLVALRALAGTEEPAVLLSPSRAVSVQPTALTQPLDPPPYRWRVGYQRRHADLGGAASPAITDVRRQFLQSEDRWGIWASGAILAAYRRPSDPEPVITALLTKAAADDLAADLGELWGTRRRLYSVPLPFSVGTTIDIGDVVKITYPMDDLRNGRLGIVVGEQLRAGDAMGAILVLV